MINSQDFTGLLKQRVEGELTRENYWKLIRSFLQELSGFAGFQQALGNRIEISENEIIVEMKITKTHESFIKMLLDINDIRSVPFSVLAEGSYEPFQSDLLVELGKNSNHFLDIGANMGFYSLALLAENPNLRVDAFEPQPRVFSNLQKNVDLNNSSTQMIMHNTALSNTQGELAFYIPKFIGSGGGSFKNLHENEEGGVTQIKVPVNVLDEVLRAQPDLIKIDVEGCELNVILGADMIIASSKPTIMVELLRKWMKPFGHTPQMFLDKMFEHNYICYAIGVGNLTEIRRINDDTIETNFIFVHDIQAKHKLILNQYAD